MGDSNGAFVVEGHMGRLNVFWEVATRLSNRADRRRLRRKIFQYVAVLTLLIAYQYALFFGYDFEFAHRPCVEDFSPVHWASRVWVLVCPHQNWLIFIHALLPALAVAMLMKLNMPITLSYVEDSR